MEENIDLQIIKLAKNKNKEALEKLYQKYELYITKIVSIFASKMKLTEEIEDLKAEANIAFLNSIESYNPELKVHFSVYLKCVIKNRLINYLKVKKKVNLESMDSINEMEKREIKSFDLFAFESTILEKLKKIIKRFSKLESQVFLCYLDNMKPSQISALLNLSKKTCENALTRVKGKFISDLKEQEILVLMQLNNLRDIIKQIFLEIDKNDRT